MMNRINNILIGLLWLLAITLGATFWFNTIFGFNIFSAQHWQHLSYMQATGQAIKPSFYISLVVIIFIAIWGLYKLLQPRFRQITMPIFDRATQPRPTTISVTTKEEKTVSQPLAQQTVAVQPNAPEQQPAEAQNIVRPPRLNIPNIPQSASVPRVPLTNTVQQKPNFEAEFAEIRKVFESTGYVFKGTPKIKGVQTAIVAIGTGEVLWIGAVGVTNTDMQRAIQTLSGVFSDTLDDIEININAFVIAAPDAATAPGDILQFANTDELRAYLTRTPNTPPDAEESENFDAYSGYIGTVIDYIGKI